MSLKLVIGAGHGGGGVTPGKRTPDGEFEWEFNDAVADGFMEEIDKYKGVEVLRVDDNDVSDGYEDVPLKERVRLANNWKADYWISFHHNANTGRWGNWTGTETFYWVGSSESKKLAEVVHKAMVEVYGLRDRGLKKGNHLYIIKNSKMPTVLTEGGFMDSLIDIKVLRNRSLLEKAGRNVAKAIAEWKKLKRKKGATSSKPSTSKSTKTSSSSGLYRVRTSWGEVKSQKGAFKSLENAKKVADEYAGYKVFDENGKVVYTPKGTSSKSGDYTVKKGDSLWRISRNFGTTVDEIKKANGLKSDVIHPGDRLVIPKGKSSSTSTKPKTTSKPKASSSGNIKVGSKVTLNKSATKYATGQAIPSYVKGKTYTVMQVKSDRVLLKEIMSWVYKKDIGVSSGGGSPSKPKTIKNGSKVKIKSSAKKYATGQAIPSYVKGKTYTVMQVKSDRVLLKEIMSWVYKKDIQ